MRNFRASRTQKVYFMLRRRRKYSFFSEKAEIAQLVEHDLAKVGVAGSSPVFRSGFFTECRTAVLHYFSRQINCVEE